MCTDNSNFFLVLRKFLYTRCNICRDKPNTKIVGHGQLKVGYDKYILNFNIGTGLQS